MLAVDGATSATTASSVLVRAWPSTRQYNIRARAGSPMAAAIAETAASVWSSIFNSIFTVRFLATSIL
jgi:hypothetical protein